MLSAALAAGEDEGEKADDGFQGMTVHRGNTLEPRGNAQAFLSPGAWQQALDSSIAANDLETLALNWAAGSVIPWERLFRDTGARIIPLPTYPFETAPYWVPAPSVPAPGDSRETVDRNLTRDQDLTRDQAPPRGRDGTGAPDTVRAVREFIARFLAGALDLGPDGIDPARNLADYGVESVIMMKLARSFEKTFKTRMKGRDMAAHASLDALSRHMAGKMTRPAESVEPEALHPDGPREPGAENRASLDPDKHPGRSGVSGPVLPATPAQARVSPRAPATHSETPAAGSEPLSPPDASGPGALAESARQADFRILERFRRGELTAGDIRVMMDTGTLVLDPIRLSGQGEDR
jgi:aryl carrier-like protein